MSSMKLVGLVKLSTPSLGITYNSKRYQLKEVWFTFNSLSRDHVKVRYVGEYPVIAAFQLPLSGSRSRGRTKGRSNKGGQGFQLPLSGSRKTVGVSLLARRSFNSLSRDHKPDCRFFKDCWELERPRIGAFNSLSRDHTKISNLHRHNRIPV